jgi:hypothetical protein
MEPVPLPLPEDVRNLLADLTGRAVAVDSDRALDVSQLPIIARYEGDDGVLLAVSAWAPGIAASAGGALAMVPRGQVEDAVSSGELNELLMECFHEVANIASRWLHSSTTPHLKLAAVRVGWEADELELAGTGRARCFTATIDGYGGGALGCAAR